MQIGALGERDGLGQDFDFFLGPGPAAEKRVEGFLEIEQPERQTQVARIEHLRLVAEAAAIFVMRIDQENPQVRSRHQNLLQDHGDAGGFADAGGAENCEMLVEQFVDIDHGGDFRVLMQRADLRRMLDRGVDQTQFVAGHQQCRFADHRIFGDAARKGRRTGLLLQFAEQIDMRDAGRCALPAVPRSRSQGRRSPSRR